MYNPLEDLSKLESYGSISFVKDFHRTLQNQDILLLCYPDDSTTDSQLCKGGFQHILSSKGLAVSFADVMLSSNYLQSFSNFTELFNKAFNTQERSKAFRSLEKLSLYLDLANEEGQSFTLEFSLDSSFSALGYSRSQDRRHDPRRRQQPDRLYHRPAL